MNQRARQNIQAVLSFLSVNRVPSVMATRAKQHIAWREHAAEVSELERKVQELLPTRLMMDITAEVRAREFNAHCVWKVWRKEFPMAVRDIMWNATSPQALAP